MPRDSNGTMTAPAGQPVVGGTPALASVFNLLVADLVAELTDSLSRSGKGGMLAPFEFSDGTVGDPSATFVNNPTIGLYRAGAGDIRLSHLGVDMAVFTTALLKLIGHCVDGATAVGITLDTVNALTTTGAKLLSVLNHAVEKFYVDKDGAVSAGSTIAAGNGLFAANGAVGATLLGNIADGATAVGVILDCVNALSTSGAKALSVRNAGVEKASIDKDGRLVPAGIDLLGGALQTILKGGTGGLDIGTSIAADVRILLNNVAEWVFDETDGSLNGSTISCVATEDTYPGVYGKGGASDGIGVRGEGGSTNGKGVYAAGTGDGQGIYATAAGSGPAVQGYSAGTGHGVLGGSAGGGAGVCAVAGGSVTRGALMLTPQSAPSSPVNGDMWVETGTNTLKVRINGATKTVTLT